MVNFEDHFWGEKYNGFEVLHQNFKQGFNASKEFTDFIKERSSIEETYAKSLLKLATKCSSANSQVGSFEPCWKFLQSSTEKLANVHNQVIQNLNEVSKICRDYGENQKEKQKQMKDSFSTTSEAVLCLQNLSIALLKAKETYELRSQEVEKCRKDFTNLKDIKNAEGKFKKSSEDYKQLIDKRETARKDFHEKMAEISKKLQTVEEDHLSQMLEILLKYGETIKVQRFLLDQIIDEFSRNMAALTAENLLQQFINLKQTGKEIPAIVDFEEIQMKSKPVDLDAIAQAIKEEKKKKKEDKRMKKTDKLGLRRKKKDKAAVNGSVEKTEEPINLENEQQLDEEGYVIRKPTDSDSVHSGKSKDSFSSDSESDSDDERQKIQVRIKPVEETQGSNSDLSEEQLKKLSATLTLISPASMLEKSNKHLDDKKFVSIWGSHGSLNALSSKSRSNNDLLNMEKNADTASLRSLPINSAIPGMDDSTQSSSSTDIHSSLNNFEASFPTSPLAASPELTTTLAGSSKANSPSESLGEPVESINVVKKSSEESAPPPLPLKARSQSLHSSHSVSFDQSDVRSLSNTSIDDDKSSVSNSFDDDKFVNNNNPSLERPTSLNNSSEKSPPTSKTKDVLMFSNELFYQDTPSDVSVNKNNTAEKSTTSVTSTKSTVGVGGLERLNPPPPGKKLSVGLPLPSGSTNRAAAVVNSLPRPKAGQLAAPPSIPHRRNTVSTTSPTSINAANSSISDLLDINFSSAVPPLSPIRDAQESETTTSHWVNPEEDANEILTTEPTASALPILSKSQVSDLNSPPLVPRRETFPLQTPVSATAASIVNLTSAERAIPIAVAFIETVNGLFKGSDDKSCVVRVTGDMTISFPANIISMLSTNNSPPVLSFIVTGTSSLEQIFPNKALVERGGQLPGGEGITFQFNMAALASYLKKQAEQGTKASYYNIDILKYQVRCEGMSTAPLQLSAYWRCDEEQTDLKIDYQYNAQCMSSSVSLNNVSVVVPVDGGVTIMQSKPTAIWSSEHQRCMWKLAVISSAVDQTGSNALRARFDLSRGPTVPAPINVQFTGEGSTISLLNFDLTSPSYKLSLVKKRFTSGRYVVEQ